MATNQTRFKTLDKVAKDPRVKEVYQDSDGIWVYFVPGGTSRGAAVSVVTRWRTSWSSSATSRKGIRTDALPGLLAHAETGPLCDTRSAKGDRGAEAAPGQQGRAPGAIRAPPAEEVARTGAHSDALHQP